MILKIKEKLSERKAKRKEELESHILYLTGRVEKLKASASDLALAQKSDEDIFSIIREMKVIE